MLGAKEKEKVKDTGVFQLGGGGEADNFTFWSRPAPSAVAKAWQDVLREVLFGLHNKKEEGSNDDEDEKDEDNEAAEQGLRRLFAYLTPEGADMEAEASSLLNHTLALGPRGACPMPSQRR